MTHILNINGVKTEIEEPEQNKMYEELTRLITVCYYWENKQCAELMRICLRARDRHKMVYGHPKNGTDIEKKVNMFYFDGYGMNHFSVFVTGIGVEINDAPCSLPDVYLKLLKCGVCRFRRKNPFGVLRKGNMFSGYQYVVSE